MLRTIENSHLGDFSPPPKLIGYSEPLNPILCRGWTGFYYENRRRSLSTGQYSDQESCLDNFVTQYMSPAQGRFTSPDAPFADQHVGDPQSWNLYSYVRNNPLSGTDPTGMGFWSSIGGFLQDALGGFLGGGGYNGGYGGGPVISGDGSEIWNEQPPVGLGGGGGSNGGGTNTGTVYGSGDGGPSINNFAGPIVTRPPNPGPAVETSVGLAVDFSVSVWALLKNFSWSLNHFDPVALSHGVSSPVNLTPYRFFGTYYCGPGGAGPRTGTVNAACAAHDDCYDVAGIDAKGNTNPAIVWKPEQVSASKGCNQALYGAVKGSRDPGATGISLWLLYGESLGQLRTGTSAHR